MNQIIQFTSFLKYPNLLHAFSTKQLGNLKPFFSNLKISLKNTVFMEQVHENKVASCDYDCAGHWMPGIDGLITTEKNLYLCVNTADCVPLFFYETQKKIIGIAHAGWRGTLGEIGKIIIAQIVEKHQGDIKNIIVGIGPSICGKCYEVDKERYDLFENIRHCERDDGKYFLDLKAINVKILIRAGIKKENIEISPYCTVCDNNLFFSYRKNKKKDYGEMAGIIGMT